MIELKRCSNLSLMGENFVCCFCLFSSYLPSLSIPLDSFEVYGHGRHGVGKKAFLYKLIYPIVVSAFIDSM